MSSIEKMEIQAIRSFGPEAVDAQRISFFKPLTLILGPNGTGKTTIIECLRYATTGDMPPGGNKNGAFIHDPKLAREREIKGQVKLAIKDMTGASCTVIRSLLAKVKDAKGDEITSKAMDGVISRLKASGEKHSVTSRCADLNREMITALGVSKAVLDNVIFCHQEDSNWPLGEAKALKLKFDSIFDATRYTKVLEELKKIQQAQTMDIKVGKEELKYLKEKKDKAQELQMDVDELQAKLDSSEASVEEVKTKLEPVKNRLEQISKNTHEIYQLQTRKQTHETAKEQIEKSMKELRKNITTPYTGSVNQLKRELQEFGSGVEDKEEQIASCEQQVYGFVADLEKTAKEKGRLLLDIGKLQQEAENYEKNVNKRNEKIKELADEYEFEDFDSALDIDDSGCKRFFALMKEKLTVCMAETKCKKIAFEEEERDIQNKIDKLREDKTKLEHSEKLKRETMEKNKKEIQGIKTKLKHMASSEEKLDRIKSQLQRVENNLTESEKTMNCEEVKLEIEQLGRQRKQLDTGISDLNSEMNRLTKQSEAQTQLNMLTADQEEKMRSIKTLQSMHEDTIVSLLGHMPVDDLRLSIETFKTNQTDSVSKCNSDLVSLKTGLSSKDAERLATANQFRQKERELQEKEDKIYSVCESQDFEEELSEVQKSLSQAREEKGSLLGADHMIKKYIRGLEKNNPNCPLCHRGFDRAQEVRELILKLEDTRRKVPHNMRKAEEEVEKQQQKCDELMQLKPVRENISVLKDKEIPNLKTKVKKLEEEIKKMKQSIEDKEDELMAKEADLDMVSRMHSDIVLMDRCKGEVKELERKIAAQFALLSGSGSERSLKTVISEKEKKQLELDNVNRTLDHKREELSDYQEQIQRLRSQVNSLKGEKLSIEGELQEKNQLENTKATLVSDNVNYQRDIEDSRAQIQPLDGQIAKVAKEKESVIAKKEEVMATAREWSDLIVNNGNAVKSVNNEIKSYLQSGKAGKQIKCQERQSELTKMESRLEQDKDRVSQELEDLRREIASHQVKQRELQDSLQLFSKEEEIKTLMVNIEDLKDKLEHFDVKNLERERQKLLREEEHLTLDLHRASGRQQGYKDEIRSKQKELKSDMYKDADKRYSSEVIKNRTMEIAGKDLNKYYKAMDQAIMRYHHSKMEEINRIILLLWRKTYQGNDIDCIEIRSEDDNAESKGITNRRTYKYRVVMIKNNVAIDMRGRCSAGQKVLASLIIRLALAETFCVNCGVLALDEPTTNLDRENIESLALALVEIIKDRHTVRHFQLVVITHDADFVELLGRAEYVDQFIEVSKNDEGLSRLNTKRVEELQTR